VVLRRPAVGSTGQRRDHPPRACAVDVQPLAGGGESVLLDDGAVVVVDHVIMTTGHVRGTHQGPAWALVTEAYPVKAYRDQVRPGEKVAVEVWP